MDRKTLLKAGRRIELAIKQLERLKAAVSYHEIEQEWYLMLVCTHSAYTLLCQANSRAPSSEKWFKKQAAAMHSDPVLEYMHYARNDEEHGIERSTGMGVAFDSKQGPAQFRRHPVYGYMMQGFSLDPQTRREFAALAPVRDNSPRGKQRKRILEVPTDAQLKESKPDKKAIAAAQIQIDFLQGLLEAAAARVSN